MDFITVFMNKLSYPKKMGLISTLFILPTLISAFFLVDNLGAKVEKAENEHDGLMYISTIRQMYQHLPQHRGMTNAYRNGSVEFRDKILEKRKQIEEDIAAIDAIDAQLGASFETTELWADTKQEWATLRDKSFRAAPKQVFEEHTVLISKLYSLIEKVARNSGLSLDSAKNTHYIMEALILDLPFITEYLGQARGLASGISASGRITVEQKLKLNNLIGAIKDKSKHILSSMRIALNENPGLIDKVNDVMSERDRVTFDFIKLIEREIISPITISSDAGNMFVSGTQAIKANYALFDELVIDLDDLLYERVDESQSYRNTILFVIFVSLSIAMMLFYVFYKSTLSTFSTLGNASKGIASGDLTVELQSEAEDESLIIVDSMNQMVSDLNGTMTKLSTDASTLASSSEELSVTTEQLKNNISHQQVQTEQIVSSMDTMTSKVKDIAENADMLAAEAQTASQETTTGSTIINQTITSINTIASGIGHAAKAVYQLEDSSNEIGSILNVIQGVAEQTNLLALNAAIEAARAGEHGRGFAVVADEVRTLATRTQESAEHIREMVNALQENTRDASSVMNSEKEKAEGILTTTQEATDSLDRIVNSMSKISNMSSQVAQIAEEQNAVSLEVNDNVTTVSQFSSSNQQSIQQVSDASQELAKLATGLNDITHNFKVK